MTNGKGIDEFGLRHGSMTPVVATMRVTRDLHEAEAALDEALIRQATLLSTMVTARRAAGLEPFKGQDALTRLLRSQQAMVDAGGELARVHGRLRTIAVETMGGNDECPKIATLTDGDERQGDWPGAVAEDRSRAA